jgi:hypothetical protein
MAEALSSHFKEQALSDILTGETVKMVLLTSGYTFSVAHEFLSDVAGAARSSEVTLANVTVTRVDDGGTVDAVRIDADDPTTANSNAFAADVGVTVTQAWVYLDSGVEATSRLVRYFDFTGASMDGGLDFTFGATGLGEWREPA